MWTFFIVILDPLIKIGLKFFDAFVNLLSKGNLVELLQYRLVKAFADSVCLGSSCPCFCVVDIFDGHVELILMVLTVSAVLGPPVS